MKNKNLLNMSISLALCLGYACSTLKKSSQSAAIDVGLHRDLQTRAWRMYDSAGSYWYYQTDSPFYYHPQQGLHGQQGFLAFAEQQRQEEQWQESRQQINVEVHTEQETQKSRKPSLGLKFIYAAIGLGVLLIGGRLIWQRAVLCKK